MVQVTSLSLKALTESRKQLNSPDREPEIREVIRRKPALKRWYLEQYGKYRAVRERSAGDGITLELGSGAGFAKDAVPGLTTSDVIPYANVDIGVDAADMPFTDAALRAVFLLNVLHHLPNAEGFFRELERTLAPGGRCLIIDQNRGWIARWILQYAHHEPYRADASEWSFPSDGPLSGANGALAWIIFVRDRARFESLFPRLKIVRIETHSPLRYWLTGGLKRWTLLPGILFLPATWFDRALAALCPPLGSFVDIELERLP